MADDYHMSTQPYQRDSTAERLKTKAAEVGQKLSERLSAFGEKAKRVLTGQARGDTSHAGAYANLNESLLSQDGGDASQSAGLHAATNGLPPSSHAGIATASSGSEAVPGLAEIPTEVRPTIDPKESEERKIQRPRTWLRKRCALLSLTIAFDLRLHSFSLPCRPPPPRLR